MKHYVEVKTQELDSLTCDACKRVEEAGSLEGQEFVSLDFTGGYTSVFGDLSRVSLDICQHCLKEHLGSFLRIDRG